MKIGLEIELEQKRCISCGRYWLNERYFEAGCPYCTIKELTLLRRRFRRLKKRLES